MVFWVFFRLVSEQENRKLREFVKIVCEQIQRAEIRVWFFCSCLFLKQSEKCRCEKIFW